jgi:hypothetical protein
MRRAGMRTFAGLSTGERRDSTVGKGPEKEKLSGHFCIEWENGRPHAAELRSDAFLSAKLYQDDADLILGRMVLARGAANIVASFSSGTQTGSPKDFGLIFTLHGVTMSQKSSVAQIASLVP